MLKQSITFESVDGEPVTGIFYFNLTKTELLELAADETSELFENIQAIAGTETTPGLKDPKLIMETFRDLIRIAYGVKGEDGISFIKRDEDWQRFRSTDAYDKLFWSLITDGAAGAKFFNAMFPANLQEEITKLIAKQNAAGDQPAFDTRPVPRVVTQPPTDDLKLPEDEPVNIVGKTSSLSEFEQLLGKLTPEEKAIALRGDR